MCPDFVSGIVGCVILIESQWNLNSFSSTFQYGVIAILIESQWNLNVGARLRIWEQMRY